jgi:hypothetical protein
MGGLTCRTSSLKELSDATADAELSVVENRLAPCSELHGIVWKRSVVSIDRRHMICENEVSDAETVRKVQREAAAAFDFIWSGDVIERSSGTRVAMSRGVEQTLGGSCL